MRAFQWLAVAIGAALARPHQGMNAGDVGVIFTLDNFKGDSKNLFEDPDNNSCNPLDGGFNIASVQVCKETNCVFYQSDNCKDYSVAVRCGDVEHVQTQKDISNVFRSYICGQSPGVQQRKVRANETLTAIPHIPGPN